MSGATADIMEPKLAHSQPTITLSTAPTEGTRAKAPRHKASRPDSIPSSPTSIHSSSSAIFERDIEPVQFQAPNASADPHHTSRAQAHEPVEASVPSVLTSAVNVLATSPSTSSFSNVGESISSIALTNSTAPGAAASGIGRRSSAFFEDEVSVIAPAAHPQASSGGGATIGLALSGMQTPKSLSRSPSPPSGGAGTGIGRRSPPAVADSHHHHPPSSFPGGLSPAPTRSGTQDSLQSSNTADDPFKANNNRADPNASGPITLDSSISSLQGMRTPPSLVAPTTAEEALSSSSANKRLSFISYHDLLNATPLAAAPLSSITSGAAPEPQAQLAASIPPSGGLPRSSGQASPARGRVSPPGTVGTTGVGWGKEDGGEWEREGLGKGLEERLEAVLAAERDLGMSQEQKLAVGGTANA